MTATTVPIVKILGETPIVNVDRALTLLAIPFDAHKWRAKHGQYDDGVIFYTKDDCVYNRERSYVIQLRFTFTDEKQNLQNFRFFFADLYRMFPGVFSSWCDSSAYLTPTWSSGGQLTLEFYNERMYATPSAAKRLRALLLNSNYN